MTLTAPMNWDSRPFTLTLAGCLAVAGMPLQTSAKPMPEVCSVCREGLPFLECPCHAETGTCPHAVPDDGNDDNEPEPLWYDIPFDAELEADALDAHCREELARIEAADSNALTTIRRIVDGEREQARLDAVAAENPLKAEPDLHREMIYSIEANRKRYSVKVAQNYWDDEKDDVAEFVIQWDGDYFTAENALLFPAEREAEAHAAARQKLIELLQADANALLDAVHTVKAYDTRK